MYIRLLKLLLVGWLLCTGSNGWGQYRVHYVFADSSAADLPMQLKTVFPQQKLAEQYIGTLPAQMAAVGYVAASVDEVAYAKDSVKVQLFSGRRYQFYQVQPTAAALPYLTAAGIVWSKKPTPEFLQLTIEKVLDYFENTGYPFAAVVLDSMHWEKENLSAVINIQPGTPYRLDSIRLIGKAKISPRFIQHFLGLPKGALYNRRLLDRLNNRIAEMQFVEQASPWQLTMLPAGGVLTLNLQPKRVNGVNVLLGLAPNNAQLASNKLLLTGEANINLKNALGAGETIGINWQQLQVKAPRISLVFQYPYIFKTAFGLDAGFELFKKDSLWVNVSGRLGAVYDVSQQQSTRIQMQLQQINVIFTDTQRVKTTKRLPDIIDVSSISLGVDYSFNNTNYRYNPRRGWDILLQSSAGTKTITPNNEILRLKDRGSNGFNYASLYDSVAVSSYRLRFRTTVNRFFPVGRQAVFKAGLQGGWFQSPDIFRNELFQIGGNKLLRGFDEESIYSDLFGVLTAEFRYLLGTNSYFFGFTDGGYAHYRQQEIRDAHTYIGFGAGLAFETGSSVFNITYAAGRRNDLPLNLRQSKIHLGFVNFF